MTQNLLAAESSPYLIQHKDNPVHWRPWNAQALNEAKTSGKPILLSVGYAACHWCHVMAHECFEDQEVADVMNRLFVNIKVDREERPDIDAIYMSALHTLGEQGGWPLTMFLTPDAEPFWGGTYFPKEPRYGRPGFIQVLNEVARIAAQEPDKVIQNKDGLIQRLRAQNRGDGGAGTLPPEIPGRTARQILAHMDPRHGGLDGAPKFPQTFLLELLWRAGQRGGGKDYLDAVTHALERMAMGGIYDHLAGGYARYSVDALWLVPHFEKMLYDNAALIDLMSLVWRDTRSELLRQRVSETIDWLKNEMLQPGGGFASSLDADSEGEEGRFYVWDMDEVNAILGPADTAFLAAHYGLTPGGNWEGKTILNRLHQNTLSDRETEDRLKTLRATLLQHRAARIRPGLDDKILADWNGLAIAALDHAAFVFERPDWRDLARGAFDFVRNVMRGHGDRLHHACRLGKPAQRGMLSDYANMAAAALALFQTSANSADLAQARAWMNVLDEQFWDSEHGGYFMTDADADDLIVRPRSVYDDATPNGNAVAAANHLRLWSLTGDSHHRDRADAIIAAFAGDVQHNPLGASSLLNSFDLALNGVDLVLAGEAQPRARLHAALRHVAHPNLTVMTIGEDYQAPPGHPAHGKGAPPGGAAAYLCRQSACSLPATTAQELTLTLRESLKPS